MLSNKTGTGFMKTWKSQGMETMSILKACFPVKKPTTAHPIRNFSSANPKNNSHISVLTRLPRSPSDCNQQDK